MITPSNEQNAVIKQIVDWYKDPKKKEFYLAGYAGVGKSTIAEIALQELQDKSKVKRVAVGAYTGKAASVLRKKGNPQAQTIHSMIYKPYMKKGKVYFQLDPTSDANNAQIIVLDECSMIDDQLANDLRSYGKKILVMGDPGQLPPVNGEGAFTRGRPDAFLQEIHRQAADSDIIRFATMVRKGEQLPKNFSKDSVNIMPLTRETQSLIYNENTQVICGLNRVRYAYTQRMRARLGYSGSEPEEGERIICCKNNNKEGIFNGQMGTVLEYMEPAEHTYGAMRLNVELEDRGEYFSQKVDPVLFENHFRAIAGKKLNVKGIFFDEFDWSYIITCHKAQGSQWEHVTVIDDSAAFKENRHKWLYTSLTRAEKGLTLLLRD